MKNNSKNINNSKNQRTNVSTGDDKTSNDPTKIYTSGNNTLQTPEEHAHDEGIDPRKNDTFSNATDDYSPTEHYRNAGTGYSGKNEGEQE